MPYSFAEYRLAHQLTGPAAPYSRQDYDSAMQHMKAFFNTGGLPAVQTFNSYEWRETLHNYVDTVILRDIIERHGVVNTQLLKYLTKTLITNAAAPFSVNKFFNMIKSQGHKISRETLIKYMDYLQDAFLIFKVPIYSESVRVRQTQPQKVYIIDNGLIQAYQITHKEMYHKLLENQVYFDLRRQNKEVFYYLTAEGYEVDFLAIAKSGARELIQVTWEMNHPETAEREQRALATATRQLGIPGRIITAQDYAVKGIA